MTPHEQIAPDLSEDRYILFIDADNKSARFAPTLAYLAKQFNISSVVVAGNHQGAAVSRWEKSLLETEDWNIPLTPFVSEDAKDAADVALIVHAGMMHKSEPDDSIFLFFSDDHLFGIAAQTFEKLGRRTFVLCGNPLGFEGLCVPVMAIAMLEDGTLPQSTKLPRVMAHKPASKPGSQPGSKCPGKHTNKSGKKAVLTLQRTTEKAFFYAPKVLHEYLAYRGIGDHSQRAKFIRIHGKYVDHNSICISRKVVLAKEIEKFLNRSRNRKKTG